MIKKILIPTDGYGLEDHVIRYTARAFPFAEFYVLSVINVCERGVQLTNLLYREMKESAKRAIEEAKNILREEGIEDIHTKMLEGIPSKIINRYAKKKDIDLIAMRVYSRKSTVSAQRMGSTVRNVIRNTRVPVLALAEECERIPIKKILFPTDGKKNSERAKNFSILFASHYKAEIEVLHVIKKGASKRHAEEIIKNVEWKASFWNIKPKKSIEEGEVVEKILEHAKNNDIIIMGIGKRFFIWHYIGHVSQTIVTHSSVPVIFIPSGKKRWKKRMAFRY
ncbi:MAG TPA: universal stress protein [Thermoplasmatales archaeon]|nr:universal stress protein [Thermoplasmatales archaeon]